MIFWQKQDDILLNQNLPGWWRLGDSAIHGQICGFDGKLFMLPHHAQNLWWREHPPNFQPLNLEFMHFTGSWMNFQWVTESLSKLSVSHWKFICFTESSLTFQRVTEWCLLNFHWVTESSLVSLKVTTIEPSCDHHRFQDWVYIVLYVL